MDEITLMTKTILVADDDPHIREVIAFALEKAQMQVVLASDGQQVLTHLQQQTCDLVVLDINMPEMDGLECCREIRKNSELPILFLSSRDDEIDRVLGLELGGDDYVTKPFSPRELVARINAILKRTQSSSTPTPTHQLTHGQVVLDTEQYIVTWQQQALHLTSTEFAILQLFMKNPLRVLTREAIMDSAYQFNVHVSDRTIDSHIRHIRHKFAEVGCESIIETLHGIGYKLAAQP